MQKLAVFSLGICMLAMPAFVSAQNEAETAEPPAAQLDSGETVDQPQDPVGDQDDQAASPGVPEVMEEPDLQIELMAEPRSNEITPLSEARIPATSIHYEKLSWNTYRFRPSYRLGAGEYEYAWDFGDGTTSDQRIVEHTFDKPGNFRITLTIDGLQGETQKASVQVSVGFFNLANWRLWVLLGILAVIIIVASVIAGLAKNGKEDGPAKPASKKKPFVPTSGFAQPEISPLAEQSGDLDTMAATGETKEKFEEELALLEEIGSVAGKAEDAQPENKDMEREEEAEADQTEPQPGQISKLDAELDKLLSDVQTEDQSEEQAEIKQKRAEKSKKTKKKKPAKEKISKKKKISSKNRKKSKK